MADKINVAYWVILSRDRKSFYDIKSQSWKKFVSISSARFRSTWPNAHGKTKDIPGDFLLIKVEKQKNKWVEVKE